MGNLYKLLSEQQTVIFFFVIPLPLIIAVCCWRNSEERAEGISNFSLYLRILSKVAMEIALVWGICSACIGLMGLSIYGDNPDELSIHVTAVLMALFWAALLTGFGFVVEKQNDQPKLTLKVVDLVLIFGNLFGTLFGAWYSAGTNFLGDLFHPILTSFQLILTLAFLSIARLSRKPWQISLFEANLAVTLIFMTLGIIAWFLNWTDFLSSKESIWLIANVLFWGTMTQVVGYVTVIFFETQPDMKLRTKSWHFVEAFAFYAFLVYAPIGTTEYFRESADQEALQTQHENQQSEIDNLRARLKELEETKTN